MLCLLLLLKRTDEFLILITNAVLERMSSELHLIFMALPLVPLSRAENISTWHRVMLHCALFLQAQGPGHNMSQEGLNCHPPSQGERATSSEKRGQDFPSTNKAQREAGRERGWTSWEQDGVAEPLVPALSQGPLPALCQRGTLRCAPGQRPLGQGQGF